MRTEPVTSFRRRKPPRPFEVTMDTILPALVERGFGISKEVE